MRLDFLRVVKLSRLSGDGWRSSTWRIGFGHRHEGNRCFSDGVMMMIGGVVGLSFIALKKSNEKDRSDPELEPRCVHLFGKIAENSGVGKVGHEKVRFRCDWA